MLPPLPDPPARPSRQSAIADALRRRVLGGVHLGTLSPDDRLASVRTVAAEPRADPRVVLAAYRQLAAEGLVRLRPRSLPRLVTAPGMFSAESARALLTAIVRRNLEAAAEAGRQRPGRSRQAGSRPWAHSRTP